MKSFVTGGAGFVGGAVVRQLLARGDQVVAAVRDPTNAGALHMSGAALVALDLAAADPAALLAAMRGADAIFHVAGSYRLGLRPRERPAMWAANVTATERVLDAVAASDVPRAVYISTANVFGNTATRSASCRMRPTSARNRRPSCRGTTAIGGHEPPGAEIPGWALRAVAAVGSVSALLRGPDLSELIRASLGVTYWFSDAKARAELGYAPRPLDEGLRTLLPKAG